MKIKHQLMKSLKTYFLLSMACLLFACACTKEEMENLPLATQTGANTFGCLVNGKVFVRNEEAKRSKVPPYSLVYPLTLGGRSEEGNIRIQAISTPIGQIYIYIYDEVSIKKGQYDIGIGGPSSFYPDYSFMNIISSGFYVSQEGSGSITLTHVDHENGVYSGTFSGTVFDEQGNKIAITEGRFDINQNTVKTQYE